MKKTRDLFWTFLKIGAFTFGGGYAMVALLDKYQLKAGESVFIDDRLENVQAAFRLGFAGIQMKDSVGTLVRSLATCSVAIH